MAARRGDRPHSADPPQDRSEQGFGDGDLRELKGHVAAMAHDLCANPDRLGA
jgi:hypothetical protein